MITVRRRRYCAVEVEVRPWLSVTTSVAIPGKLASRVSGHEIGEDDAPRASIKLPLSTPSEMRRLRSEKCWGMIAMPLPSRNSWRAFSILARLELWAS
jgi:hypothetical protein